MIKEKLLPPCFFERDTVQVAHDLIGKKIVRIINGQTIAGIINETEAYCGMIDAASHAYKGQTNRNKAMFGPVGHSYVYFIYGNHYCLNIVSKEKDVPAGGVLIRSLIPIDGLEYMKQLRNTDLLTNLTNGPGKIGQALALTINHNHINITQEGELYITEGIQIKPQDIQATPRIGISKAQDKLWRFILNANR